MHRGNPYRMRMRHAASAGHFVLVSVPVLAMLAVLATVYGTEAQTIWAFRLHKDAYPTVKSVMSFITDWGNPFMYLGFVIMFVRARTLGDGRRTRYALTYILVQLAVCLLLVSMVKMSLGRPRPYSGELFHQMLTWDPDYHSLPSGHTAEIMGTCLALALWLRNGWKSLALGLVVGLMGFTRIYLNQHYPSDVLFGWLFGSLAGWSTYTFGRGKDSPYHE